MWILKKSIAVLYFALIFVVNVQGQSLEYEESPKDMVEFYVYTRQNEEMPQALKADAESIVRNILNPTKPTTLAIHNMRGNKNAEEYFIIKESKLKIEDANIIIVDYSSLIYDNDFDTASTSAHLVAQAITDLIVLLYESFNMDLQNLHIVGFNLGAQIAGLVGKDVYQRCGEKLKRITALDPVSLPFNETTRVIKRLTPDDAYYVEVVHTNAGGSGFLTPCGHVDYYPNGGKVQPGCSAHDNYCSHKRAYELIPEMWLPVQNRELFMLKCFNIKFMSLNNCRWLNEKMGDLQQYPMGLYYVETDAVKPFGKGAFKSQFL